MISTLQKALRLIRQCLGLGVQEFADLIGVTRQTVNNLETQKREMSVTQFVAICSVIDHFAADKPQIMQIIYQFLRMDHIGDNVFSADGRMDIPLSKRWFALFGDYPSAFGMEDKPAEKCDFRYLVEHCRIFFDDSIFLEPSFEEAAEPLFHLAEERGVQFIVPFRAIELIQRNRNADRSIQTENSFRFYERLCQRGLLQVRGEKHDTNVAGTLISVFAKFKCEYQLALFTQRKDLAEQILCLNGNTIGGFDILVYQLYRCKEFFSWNGSRTELTEEHSNITEADLETDFTDPFCGWNSIE